MISLLDRFCTNGSNVGWGIEVSHSLFSQYTGTSSAKRMSKTLQSILHKMLIKTLIKCKNSQHTQILSGKQFDISTIQ